MRPRERSYRCTVCGWQGRAEPLDAGEAAPCPQCGVYLYPLSWVQTWGLALVIMLATAGVLVVVASFL
jgi:uncharacterized paraquat-inducible protein A